MRLGIFGGSFDPPHLGHLLVAIDAVEALRLDLLAVVPAAVQPLKAGQTVGSKAQRLAMVRALIDGEPSLVADPVEVDRDGLSYSVDTVADFARRFPGAERFFLIGTDVVSTIPKWRSPDRIAELAHIVVLRRGDDPVPDVTAVPGGAMVLSTRRIDVSSTEIRERVRQGKSVRGFVPDAVASYIAAEQLYR